MLSGFSQFKLKLFQWHFHNIRLECTHQPTLSRYGAGDVANCNWIEWSALCTTLAVFSHKFICSRTMYIRTYLQEYVLPSGNELATNRNNTICTRERIQRNLIDCANKSIGPDDNDERLKCSEWRRNWGTYYWVIFISTICGRTVRTGIIGSHLQHWHIWPSVDMLIHYAVTSSTTIRITVKWTNSKQNAYIIRTN